jgi:hypothetical protein
MDDMPRIQCPRFKIHNRTGSVQLTLQPAHFDGEAFESRNGIVHVMEPGYLMIEMANAGGQTDPNGTIRYDWAGKVSMKLNPSDIQLILDGLKGGVCRIVHDPNKARGDTRKGTLPHSRLEVKRGEKFGFFMTMSQGERKARCPVCDGEASTLRLLLTRAIVRIYGW